MKACTLPFRQIHLDFHTSPAVREVGTGFDAEQFAETMAQARVDSVTLFAKCHHGHLYYNTKHPARHPTLPKGLDLLGEQIEALHRRDIQAPVYVSVQCDEYAANTHPEWIAINADGTRVGRKPLSGDNFSWQILDMSSAYADYLADQIDEVCREFKPLDGLFLDMCWDQISLSRWAIEGMRKRRLDPSDEQHRATYARAVVHKYMERYNRILASHHRRTPPKVWYNSRPKTNLPQEVRYLRHVEIEALPTGGWGYVYFPLNVRFARTFRLPYLGMTGRFHKGWADFGGLKPAAALKYECALMLAHGAQCSVGDQLHPRGTLDKAAYGMIGRVYRHVEACEPWCRDAVPVTEIGVLRPLAAKPGENIDPYNALAGVVRGLQQLHHQFDFVHADSDVDAYELLIVPEIMPVDPALRVRLRDHVRNGGALLLCGSAGVGAGGTPLLAEQGVTLHGNSPFTTTYLRFEAKLAGDFGQTDHVMYERGIRMRATTRSAKVLCRVVEPYFDRSWERFCSHAQTPGTGTPSAYVAAVCRDRVATLAYPLFTAIAQHGNLPYRHLLKCVLDQLLPRPLTRFCGPHHVELTVTRQQKKRRSIVHVLSYVPERRTPKLDIVEDAFPLQNVSIYLRCAQRPKRVQLQPLGLELPFEWADGYACLRFSSDHGHDMIVIVDR